jgi:hypothetical protein
LRENFDLKQNIESLTKNLEDAKQSISELKLNGYSGSHVNGMYDNGEIFRIGHDYSSRLVSEKEHYSIQAVESQMNGVIVDSTNINNQ